MPFPDASGRFEKILRFAADRQISDVHLKSGQRPIYRRAGTLINRREETPFIDGELAEIAQAVLSPNQAKAFSSGAEVSCIYAIVGTGRFRVHLYRQRQSVAIAVRVLSSRVVTLRDLRLPAAMAGFCAARDGLVLLCGAPGSGVTTTLMAVIDTINTSAGGPRHVVTLERPIETQLEDKLAFICQREVGLDTPSWPAGLRGALRQDVDVIALARVPDSETLSLALGAAESGVLVFACIEASDIARALRRLMAMETGPAAAVARQRLASVLIGACSQRLGPGADGQSRFPAGEVLMANEHSYRILCEGSDPAALYDVMHTRALGMQTVDQSLVEMARAGVVKPDVAARFAMRPAALKGGR